MQLPCTATEGAAARQETDARPDGLYNRREPDLTAQKGSANLTNPVPLRMGDGVAGPLTESLSAFHAPYVVQRPANRPDRNLSGGTGCSRVVGLCGTLTVEEW